MYDKCVLKRAYYTPSHPGREVSNEEGKQMTVSAVKDFLSEQDTYTLHKPARINLVRNRVFVLCPPCIWVSFKKVKLYQSPIDFLKY